MLPEVNLLPKYERSESVLFHIFIAGLLLCTLLFAVLGYFYFTAKSDLNETEESVSNLTQEKNLLEANINSLNPEQTTSFDQALTFVESYQTPTSLLVNEFIKLLPDQGYLSELTYDYDAVTVETQFETMTDASVYIRDLVDSAYLNHVEIDYMETFTLEEETEETEQLEDMYEAIPRYLVSYSVQLNHPSLAGEEENNEKSISGE